MNITSSSLTSSMKAKLKATNAFTETLNDESTVSVCGRSRLKTSIHTIGVKESPQKNYSPVIGFNNQSQRSNLPHTPPKVITKRISPINKIVQISSIPTSEKVLKSSQSVSYLSQGQGILMAQDNRGRSRQTVGKQVVQPFESLGGGSYEKKRCSIQPRLSKDRYFVKVQVSQQSRRLSSTKMLPVSPLMTSQQPDTFNCSSAQIHHHPTTLTHNSTAHKPSIYKSTSPTKHHTTHVHFTQSPILKQISQNKPQRQVELQRKIKVLEIRVGQLHLEKGVMETKMNELVIRLQYENSFLKEKLNLYPSLTQIAGGGGNGNTAIVRGTTANNSHLKQIDQVPSQPSQNSLFFTCPIKPDHRKSIQNNLSSDRSRFSDQNQDPLNIEFVDTQDYYYNNLGGQKMESQQILTLRHKLLEVEEMLAKEVGKNLKLLEELGSGEKREDQMGQQVKRLNGEIGQLKEEISELSKALIEERQTNEQKQNQQITFLTQQQQKQNQQTTLLTQQITLLTQQINLLHSQPSSTSPTLATQTTRITRQFQDKILSLQMQISWLNEKLQEAEKLTSQVKLELDKYGAMSKVEVVDREQVFGKLEVVRENDQLREEVEVVRGELVEVEREVKEVKGRYEECVQENQQLRDQVMRLKQQLSQSNSQQSDHYRSPYQPTTIPEQFLHQQQQTNQILMSTIKSLQNSLAFSQQSIHQLMNHKIQLQSKLHNMELELSHYAYKEQQYDLQMQAIGKKLQQIGELVQEKTKQVQHLSKRTYQQQYVIEEKQHIIMRLESSLQTLQKRRDDSKTSTQNSYYDKPLSTCGKCEEMRNNLTKLNSYLSYQSQPITAPFSSSTFKLL